MASELSEQEQLRRDSLAQLRALGINPYPAEKFEVTATAREILESGTLHTLQAGERVPADGILLSGKLQVDQSALNGETKEAEKTPTQRQTDPRDLLAANRLFRGSVVCSGEGVLLVKAVGDSTFYGGLAREIQEETGLSVDLDTRFRQVVIYYPKPGVIKDVVFFLATPVAGHEHPQEGEIAQLGWFPYQQALPLVTFASDVEVLKAAERYLAGESDALDPQ